MTPGDLLPSPKLLTGRAWGDFLLGAAAQYLVHSGTTRLLLAILGGDGRQYASNANDRMMYVGLYLVIFTVAEGFATVVLGALVDFAADGFPQQRRGVRAI